MTLSFIVKTLFLLAIQNPVSIFNGVNLEGWKVYGTERWYVKDSELICESGPDKGYGYLATEKYYKNFILTLDFFQEKDGNSGVFFRSKIDGTKISGWQVEIAPPGFHSGGIYESYGRGWLIKPDKYYDDIVKVNEWNSLKLTINDGEVKTWINGQEMISIRDNKISNSEGSIALQIHDGGGIKVKWRDLKLVEL
tara:strand:+ start:1353 stop:1937 length:585 start_codon:yes stop_codon:yes gene_type:complete